MKPEIKDDSKLFNKGMVPPVEAMKKPVMKYFKPPFKFDKMGGYIFDNANKMVAEVRAWGYLQYKPDGEKLQDELGEIIAESLTKYFNHEK